MPPSERRSMKFTNLTKRLKPNEIFVLHNGTVITNEQSETVRLNIKCPVVEESTLNPTLSKENRKCPQINPTK